MASSSNPDCRNRGRGVWLVKVPKYLSQKWREKAGAPQVGRLKLIKASGPNLSNSTIVKFYSTVAQSSQVELPVPIEHTLNVSSLNNQSLIVLNEDRPSLLEQVDDKPTILSIEGKVVQRAECKPCITDPDYKSIKKQITFNAGRPKNQVQSIEKAENKFKPVSRHVEHQPTDRTKRDNKSVRMDKNALTDILFQAFEKHQYYKLTDLARVTSQPPSYLKEILQEIAAYNTMPPHKYTWELKPEYRHYKEQGEEKMDV